MLRVFIDEYAYRNFVSFNIKPNKKPRIKKVRN